MKVHVGGGAEIFWPSERASWQVISWLTPSMALPRSTDIGTSLSHVLTSPPGGEVQHSENLSLTIFLATIGTSAAIALVELIIFMALRGRMKAL